MAASAEELNNQAEELKDAVSFFKIDGYVHQEYVKTTDKKITKVQKAQEVSPIKPVPKTISKGVNIQLGDKDEMDDAFIDF